jgi:hypothetical protein
LFFFLPSVAPAGKYFVWSAEGLPSTFGGSGWQWAVRVVTHFFFQCIVAWRILPQDRGSGCQSFSSPCCFTSAKHVSRVSTRSLIPLSHSYFHFEGEEQVQIS